VENVLPDMRKRQVVFGRGFLELILQEDVSVPKGFILSTIQRDGGRRYYNTIRKMPTEAPLPQS
jgi:hypothetical protein